MDKRVKWITAGVLLILVAVAVYGLVINPGVGPDHDYGIFYDGVFFSFVTLFLYWKYERFNQSLLTYSMMMCLILFHIVGAFWLYGRQWGVLQFDMIMHAVGGFILAFFFYKYLNFNSAFETSFKVISLVILGVLGLSVFHEFMEFFGYNYFGRGMGVFQYGAGDFGEYNDIMWDFISNVIGAIPGAILAFKVYPEDRN